MSRAISTAARDVQDAVATADGEIVFIRIRHPELLEDILLCSVALQVLSYEPYQAGARSTWLDPEGDDFLAITMGVRRPSDSTEADAPMQAALVLEDLDGVTTEILTSTIVPAEVDLAVAMQSSPDFIERKFLGLLMYGASGRAGQVALDFSRRNVPEEPCPADRTTKERFPGLHQ